MDIKEKEKSAEQIVNLTKEIENLQFSIEFLFREFYIKEYVNEKIRFNDP